MSGPTRVFVPLHKAAALVDVSNGAIVKGLGAYYVPADIADDMFAALEAVNRKLTDAGAMGADGLSHGLVRAAIARAKGDAKQEKAA